METFIVHTEADQERTPSHNSGDFSPKQLRARDITLNAVSNETASEVDSEVFVYFLVKEDTIRAQNGSMTKILTASRLDKKLGNASTVSHSKHIQI